MRTQISSNTYSAGLPFLDITSLWLSIVTHTALLSADFQWAQSSYTVNEGEGLVKVCLEIAPNRVLSNEEVSVALHTPWKKGDNGK